MKRDRLQVIVIKDELGNYSRFTVSKKLLVVVSTLFLGTFTLLAVFSGLSLKEHFKREEEKKELTRRMELLENELKQLSTQNARLRTQVAQLKREKEETVKQLAKRIEEINSIMKRVGLKTENPGEGGTAVPVEKVLTDPEIDLKELIPGVDSLIKSFKTTPVGYPTSGRITSDYGLRRNPITGALEFHLGVDIANRWGTPVRATAEGRVVKAGWCGLLGRCVEIEHGNGFKTFYGHLAKVIVHRGQKVERGMIIGIMGSTGRSTGPHLHYAIKYRGRIINPEPFLEVSLDKEKRQGGKRRN